MQRQQETQLALTNRATYLCKSNKADLKKHALPHMWYYAKFGPSTLKCVGINTEELPKIVQRCSLLVVGT